METIVLMFIAGMGIGGFNAAVGDHQEPPKAETVAVISETTGEVLYYVYK